MDESNLRLETEGAFGFEAPQEVRLSRTARQLARNGLWVLEPDFWGAKGTC